MQSPRSLVPQIDWNFDRSFEGSQSDFTVIGGWVWCMQWGFFLEFQCKTAQIESINQQKFKENVVPIHLPHLIISRVVKNRWSVIIFLTKQAINAAAGIWAFFQLIICANRLMPSQASHHYWPGSDTSIRPKRISFLLCTVCIYGIWR